MTDCKVRKIGQTLYLKAFGLCRNNGKNESTRERILEAAFEEMYEHGFQGMRIENVLAKTGLAKGALYHHFPSKKTLGYAVVDEVLFATKKNLLAALETTDDPITTSCEILNAICEQTNLNDISLGCPLNNLAQEMCGLDEGFNERLTAIYTYWQNTLANALLRGQNSGLVKADINPPIVAMFIISAIQGITGTTKCMQSIDLLKQLTGTLCDYLRSLRA